MGSCLVSLQGYNLNMRRALKIYITYNLKVAISDEFVGKIVEKYL